MAVVIGLYDLPWKELSVGEKLLRGNFRTRHEEVLRRVNRILRSSHVLRAIDSAQIDLSAIASAPQKS